MVSDPHEVLTPYSYTYRNC